MVENTDEMTRRARLDAVLDRQDIFDCLQRISRGIDRFDRALFLSGYHPDAIIDAGALVADPERVYDHGRELHEHGQEATLHHLHNHSCELAGETAHSETYFFYVGRNRDGTNWQAGGRYLDRLECRAGRWKVVFRYTVMEWSGELPTVAVPLFENVADLHRNGVPCRDDRDPSYRRPLLNRRAVTVPADARALSTPDAAKRSAGD